MKKNYSIQNFHCPNCANKFCNALRQLQGIQSVEVNFGTPTLLTVEVADEQVSKILPIATQLAKRIEPNAIIEEIL